MNEHTFSIGDAFRAGWEGWKKHWALLVGLVFITGLLGGLPGIFLGGAIPNWPEYPALSHVLGYLLGVYASLGLVTVTLKIAKGEEVSFGDYFSTFSYYAQYLLGTILYSIIVIIGLIFFIVPGIIFAMKYYLFPYFIIDRKVWPLEAFKLSDKAVYGAKWDLFLFSVLAALLNILGLISLLIGLFITVPVILIAQAAIYKRLNAQLS